MQITLFRGSSYEMPKVKNYLLVNLYISIVILILIYRYSKVKKLGDAAFFQIRSVLL